MKIEFTFPGEPVPAPRMTQRTLWTDEARNYLAYKRHFSEAIRQAFPQYVLDIPPTTDKKARTKFLKEWKNVHYRLVALVYDVREKGDWDNYGKTLGDLLQDSGVIVNDRKIKDGRAIVMPPDPENPRIEFTLERIQ